MFGTIDSRENRFQPKIAFASANVGGRCTARRYRAATDEKCRKTSNIIQKIPHSNRTIMRHQVRLQFINVCTKWMGCRTIRTSCSPFFPIFSTFVRKLMCSIAMDARPHEDDKKHWEITLMIRHLFFYIRCLIVRGFEENDAGTCVRCGKWRVTFTATSIFSHHKLSFLLRPMTSRKKNSM